MTLEGILRALILPPASLLLLVAAALMMRKRSPRLADALHAVSIILLAVLCTAAGARLLVRPLEQQTAPLTAPDGGGAQAIVVLAAGRLERAPEYGGNSIPDYIALARLRYAAHLHRRTSLPVMVSGGNADQALGPKAVDMALALEDDFGIPVKWVERKSQNTAENAKFAACLLLAEDVKRILLVTDAMHMPRSVAAFERNGINAIAAPTMFFGSDRLAPLDFLPSDEGLRQSRYALYEWLGLAYYRIRYGHDSPAAGSQACRRGTVAM